VTTLVNAAIPFPGSRGTHPPVPRQPSLCFVKGNGSKYYKNPKQLHIEACRCVDAYSLVERHVVTKTNQVLPLCHQSWERARADPVSMGFQQKSCLIDSVEDEKGIFVSTNHLLLSKS